MLWEPKHSAPEPPSEENRRILPSAISEVYFGGWVMGTAKTKIAPRAPLRVLGLDPGSHATGYAVIQAAARGPRLTLVDAGVIRAPAKAPLADRLLAIHDGLIKVIAEHRPLEMAVENVFSMVNVKTALVLGQARGVALLAGASRGLAVFEYNPTAVKKALVGVGRASKEQVRAMVAQLLGAGAKLPLDASDACALAICHHHSRALASKGLK